MSDERQAANLASLAFVSRCAFAMLAGVAFGFYADSAWIALGVYCSLMSFAFTRDDTRP